MPETQAIPWTVAFMDVMIQTCADPKNAMRLALTKAGHAPRGTPARKRQGRNWNAGYRLRSDLVTGFPLDQIKPHKCRLVSTKVLCDPGSVAWQQAHMVRRPQPSRRKWQG